MGPRPGMPGMPGGLMMGGINLPGGFPRPGAWDGRIKELVD